VSLLSRVSMMAAADGDFEPPDSVVEEACAIFPVRAPRTAVPRTHRLLARLVFDSFSQPLPAGVRSRQRLTRQLMYRAGEIFVDLRLDREQGQRRVALVGQIAGDRGRAAASDVVLLDGREPIARAPVNEFGEFQLECEPGAALRLRIPLAGDPWGLDVPLARLAESGDRRRTATDRTNTP
jgi:hypothetical protein